ncbi:MAG: gfo/Idh/MocA family oxidoreductase, partial [Proteobacteria bacterium]|nr:gfo/Idh/MocA family oxidoreductase [Pseudomonadota bacterium]
MTTGRPVRVALLGCGAIAQAHLRAIAANPGLIEVAGLYDADRGRADARA